LSTLVLTVGALAGCYHATIETGLPPGTQTFEKPWASAWVFGLVPPQTVETASRCPNGVARVETQLSFLNQLVNILTIGIYTPMTIEITCAGPDMPMDEAGRDTIAIDARAGMEEKQQALKDAAAEAARRGAPVLVKFE
jgi:hypothetical protein